MTVAPQPEVAQPRDTNSSLSLGQMMSNCGHCLKLRSLGAIRVTLHFKILYKKGQVVTGIVVHPGILDIHKLKH